MERPPAKLLSTADSALCLRVVDGVADRLRHPMDLPMMCAECLGLTGLHTPFTWNTPTLPLNCCQVTERADYL